MSAHVRVGGAWREAAPRVQVGGTWRQVSDAWVRVGGVWRKAYTNTRVKLTPVIEVSPILLSLVLRPSGVLATVGYNGADIQTRADEWCSVGRTPTIGEAYEARVTINPGPYTILTNAPMAEWVSLGELRQWTVPGIGLNFQGVLEIRKAGESQVLASTTLQLEVPPIDLSGF